MKVFFYAILLILILAGLVLFIKFNDEELTEQEIPVVEIPTPNQYEIECRAVGGAWKEYSNGCVDACVARRPSNEGFVCTTAFTYGCDCGAERCWNGNTCEPN